MKGPENGISWGESIPGTKTRAGPGEWIMITIKCLYGKGCACVLGN